MIRWQYQSVAAAAMSCALASSSFAYDYVKDVLIGNTVEISNQISGESSRFFFNADNTVIMHVQGKADEAGKWRETDSDLCTTYPSQGAEVCSGKPSDVTVPGERRFQGSLLDGTKYDVLIKWLKGQVRY
jgi:hypothetical protein